MSTPLAFLGLPSLHSIIEGIAKGFFGALAHAVVPSWLAHGTVATIQHLVALPDPGSWTHVGELESDMVFLGAMLLPATLAIGTVRYWIVGLTGAAHPATALGRGVWVTFVLVGYRWIVEQVVAAANTLTHAVLGFPVVASGLQRIIGVLFGGALLSGAGGVFGAFLVIIGVLFAAGLFAAKVLLTVVLAGLTVAGPPLIALSPVSELGHLSRAWAHALLVVALVPFAWTVLFSTAGALCLDATSFTGGAGGVPGHVEAAFAGLITFALALLLPLMLLGSIRHMLVSAGGGGRGGAQAQSTMPGASRVRAAHTRLRAVALEGVPSLGRSAGRAAGALGTPAGGPLGAARRTLGSAARRVGGISGGSVAVAGAAGLPGARQGAARTRRGVRERLRSAGAVLVAAPREARAAVLAASAPRRGAPAKAARARAGTTATKAASSATPTSKRRPGASGNVAPARSASGASAAQAPRRSQPARIVATPSRASASSRPAPTQQGGRNPARRVQIDAARDAARPAKAQGTPTRPPRAVKPSTPPPTPPRVQRPRKQPRRKPRPRSGT